MSLGGCNSPDYFLHEGGNRPSGRAVSEAPEKRRNSELLGAGALGVGGAGGHWEHWLWAMEHWSAEGPACLPQMQPAGPCGWEGLSQEICAAPRVDVEAEDKTYVFCTVMGFQSSVNFREITSVLKVPYLMFSFTPLAFVTAIGPGITFDETWSWPCSQVFPVQKEGGQFAAGKIGTEHPLLHLCLARSFFRCRLFFQFQPAIGTEPIPKVQQQDNDTSFRGISA